MVIKMNKIIDIETNSSCEQKSKCPEPKLHKKKKEKKKKLNRYEIAAHIYDDRNPIMRKLLMLDPDAHFKVISKWRFKIETSLTENQILAVLTKDNDPFEFKKVRFM